LTHVEEFAKDTRWLG